MSTYVISDVHGYAKRFFDLLDQIEFNPREDELYVLGDIIDRGPEVGEMCEWAWNNKDNDHIHFLLGNHEDMMLYSMRQPYHYWDDMAYCEDNISHSPHIWFWNGGERTYEDLMTWEESKRHDFIKWVDTWPLFYDIEVNGRRFVMVHAGMALRGVKLNDDHFDGGKNQDVEIPSFGTQWSQTLLWVRESWLTDCWTKLPCDVIFGHTPTYTIYPILQFFKDDPHVKYEGGENDILHINGRKHAIDTGRSRMGILRLDDMKEWYSEK